jgi:hypothetical protein
MNSSRMDPATFRLVALCLNQLRYRVPHEYAITLVKYNVLNPLASLYRSRQIRKNRVSHNPTLVL